MAKVYVCPRHHNIILYSSSESQLEIVIGSGKVSERVAPSSNRHAHQSASETRLRGLNVKSRSGTRILHTRSLGVSLRTHDAELSTRRITRVMDENRRKPRLRRISGIVGRKGELHKHNGKNTIIPERPHYCRKCKKSYYKWECIEREMP
jgi:hypothetical protein